MPVRLHLLGVPRFERDGQPVAVAWQRQTLPLLALLFTARIALPRDGIALTLWPDDDEETARTQLRRNLNLLRTLVPPEAAQWIVADSGSLAFCHASASTDVADFETALDDARDLGRAIENYTGDFIASIHEPYVLVERERLRARLHGALTDLVGHEFSARRFTSALAYARRILADEPLREDVIRRVIAIRFAMGDRPGALTEYDRFARTLRVEMSIDPMPETSGLRELILRGEPLPFAPEASVIGAAGPAATGAAAGLLPFAGRRATLDALEACWAEACAGAGSVAFVCGEAGIGKSRVVAEFLERNARNGARILRGTTASPEALPYEALLAAFAQAAPFVPTLGIESVWLAEIARLVPEVAQRSRAPLRAPLTAEREATRLLEALARFALAVARQRPTVIVLEDMHWAQTATLDALRYLAPRLRGHALLVVATTRTGEHPPVETLIRELGAARLANALVLSRLTPDETLDLLARAEPPVTGPPAHEVVERSEGHPLFLCELLRSDPATRETGGGIVELVGTRLAQCSAPARLLARIAAICGTTFDLDLLAAAAGWDDDALIDGLAELLRRHFVRSTAAHERGTYTFTHALVHAAILDSADDLDRRRIHRIAARILEARATARFDADIARHWTAAGEPSFAAAAYERAARESFAASAHDEAAHLATLGLAQTDDPARTHALLTVRIRANMRRAARDVVRADISRLHEAAALVDDDARFAAALLAFESEEASGERVSQIAAARALREFAGDERHPLRDAQIADVAARNSALQGAFPEALQYARDAAERYAACDKRSDELRLRIFTARLMVRQGYFDEAHSALVALEPDILTGADPALALDYWYARSSITNNRRDAAGTLLIAARVEVLARAAGDRLMEGHAALLRGCAYIQTSELTRALREMETAETIYRSIGASDEFPRNNRAAALIAIGRHADAALILRSLYDEAGATGATSRRYFAASNLGCALLAQDLVDEALRLQREALALAREMESDGYAALALGDLGAAEIAAGDRVAGLRHLRESIAIHRRLDRKAVLAHDLARAAGAESDPADGAIHARGALALVEAGAHEIALAPEILARCARAFERAADGAAANYCRLRGRALLAERAQMLDADDRQVYLEQSWHVALAGDHFVRATPALGRIETTAEDWCVRPQPGSASRIRPSATAISTGVSAPPSHGPSTQ